MSEHRIPLKVFVSGFLNLSPMTPREKTFKICIQLPLFAIIKMNLKPKKCNPPEISTLVCLAQAAHSSSHKTIDSKMRVRQIKVRGVLAPPVFGQTVNYLNQGGQIMPTTAL